MHYPARLFCRAQVGAFDADWPARGSMSSLWTGPQMGATAWVRPFAAHLQSGRREMEVSEEPCID